MLGDLISQDMFGYWENKRKWRKVENYIERRSLKSSTIRKSIPKSPNESITFLFIGQGQKDTWHHLKGLPDAFSSRNMEKNTFSHEPQQFRMMMRSRKSISLIFVFLKHFAWLYEITFTFPLYVAAKPILFHFTWLCENFAWSCEITFHIFLVCCSQAYSVSFHMIVRKFRMVMQNWKTCFFDSSLQFLSFLHF